MIPVTASVFSAPVCHRSRSEDLPITSNTCITRSGWLGNAMFADVDARNPTGENVGSRFAGLSRGGRDGVVAFGGGYRPGKNSGLHVRTSLALSGTSRNVDDW
jgi:hypothetical protein